MKVLILGSSGVVGKALHTLLESQGHDVIPWDISISPDHDLAREFSLPPCDFVFFLAYNVGGSKYLSDIQLDFINNNVDIMKNTFGELRRTKTPFVFASSQMYNMDNVYGTLKFLGEHYTRILGGLSVRFWNVYGPEEINEKSHVIPDFIDQYVRTNHINMMTTGIEERQFLHTADCAKALAAVMDHYDTIKQKETSVDITSFQWTTIRNLAYIIAGEERVTPGEREDTVQGKRNEPRDYILHFWKPEITLEKGIHELLLS